MWYEAEVYVKQTDRDLLLDEYQSDQMKEPCSQCPDHNQNWSCGPGLPDLHSYLEDYNKVFVVAVKVNYTEEVTGPDVKKEDAIAWRNSSYEKVKKRLLMTLMANEKTLGGGKTLGAGKCLLCGRCTRADGKPCRFPASRRYSFTSFGFDFGRMLKDFFDLELTWSSDPVPDHDMAVAALFYKEEE